MSGTMVDAGGSPGGFNLEADPGGLTAGQAARAVGFSDEMIRRWAVEEGLPHTVVDGCRRFRLDEVRAWIAANGKGQSNVGGKKPGAGRPKGGKAASAAQANEKTLEEAAAERAAVNVAALLSDADGLTRAINGDVTRATAAQAVEIYKAATAKLEYEREAGRLVRRDDVTRTWSELLRVLRMRLEDMAERLTPELAAALRLDPDRTEQARAILAAAAGRVLAEIGRDPLGDGADLRLAG